MRLGVRELPSRPDRDQADGDVNMQKSMASCVYCSMQAYENGDGRGYCATAGCPAYHDHAYLAQQAILTLGSLPPGWLVKELPISTESIADNQPPLYETSPEEKRQAGIALQSAQSVMDAWERLEKKGYTLARRTKP